MPANVAASRYEIKELLGEGGMGVVYRALDTRTNSYVALKTLRDATDPSTLDMFKREWEELGKLVHPNIVDVRDVDEIEENGVRKPCFIMPLLPGCTLAALIKSSSPRLTTDFVVSMVSQVCKGLQAAHEKDLIHRDLKPSNIFIMEDDTAKIIDFGLVHAVGNKSVTGLKGTWQYMAPEQIDGSKQPNRSFDIFSLGVVAYEALTGHQPFKRAKFEDTVEAVRYFVPQAISERNPKVPQLVSKAVHVAMAKQPMHRYSSAREFAETLQKASQNQYIERFDPAKIRPRIDRAKKAFIGGDSEFATEILTELEAEGNLDPEITLLRSQIDESNKQKRVRQLFEAAQTRLEQDEIPLAREKLQEVLKIDPQNSEALKLQKRIDQQQSDRQVSEWLDLARKHLDLHDFSEARRALKEVFNLKYDDPEAARLKAQVDTREKEVETARAEKEHLYSFALRHNQNGEISSALSKLEKLLELSRNTPGASVPERDKVFQAFYNDVRTERDRIDNAYSEGARHLSDKNFEKALQVCDGILSRYPQNPQFQALRLKVEHSQRQELSAYIAEVGRAAESEPNLDRRVGILEEAYRRYPKEDQFSRQLSLARELRDLVGSIETRARNYEEQGQFAEAITQWNTLANIHPQYPGIDFEISQLERRREQQAEEDKKSRLIEKIDRALGNAAYADAERLSQEALVEFPQNKELQELLRQSHQGLERAREADRLFAEAKLKRSAGYLDQAVSLLRQALELDTRNIVILNTLVNLLVERAHTLLDSDPAAAEPLAAEADRLDPDHPSVKKVIALITQAKRKHFVEQTVLEARQLQTVDRNRAIDILKEGLTAYPGDGRLQQTLTSLQKDEPRTFAAATGFGGAVEDRTAYYPTQASAPPSLKAAAPPAKAPASERPAAPRPQSEPPKPADPARPRIHLAQLKDNGKSLWGGDPRNLIGVLGGLLASAILLGIAYRFLYTTPPPPAPKGPRQFTVNIHTSPDDAAIRLDDRQIGKTTPRLDEGSIHHVSVSHLGYKTVDDPALKVTGASWDFALLPEPLQINLSISESNGSVWLDGQNVGALQEGSWSHAEPLKPSEEQHVLSVKGPRGELILSVGYASAAGKPPAVQRLQTKDLLVASSLGKDARLYAGSPSTELVSPTDGQIAIPATGLPVNIEDAPDGFHTANGIFPVTGSNAPTLGISLNAAPNLASITISVTPPSARLLIDREPAPRPRKPGLWSWKIASGMYQGKLIAPGMQDKVFPIVIQKGKPFVRDFKMTANAPVGPTPATVVILGGEPNAEVSVGGISIGQLDGQGNLTSSQIPPGSREITISKPGYHPFVSKQMFLPGKSLKLPDVKKLVRETGYAVFAAITPPNAKVFYKSAEETDRHQVVDMSKPLALAPDNYEFSADAPKYLARTLSIKIRPDETAPISLTLQPLASSDTKVDFVNMDEVVKENGDWYHGRTDKFIQLLTPYKKNTILFPKEYKPKVKKMTGMIFLDNDNSITYSIDAKKITITPRSGGVRLAPISTGVDASGLEKATDSWVIAIQLEKTGVTITTQSGTIIDTVSDDKHDWSHAKLYVKGDTYFTCWPGR